MVKELLDEQFIWSRDDNGLSALHKAARGGSVAMVRLLIGYVKSEKLFRDFSKTLCDERGHTALHMATSNNHVGVVKLLLDLPMLSHSQASKVFSAFFREVKFHGTPFDIAVMCDRKDIASMLLESPHVSYLIKDDPDRVGRHAEKISIWIFESAVITVKELLQERVAKLNACAGPNGSVERIRLQAAVRLCQEYDDALCAVAESRRG